MIISTSIQNCPKLNLILSFLASIGICIGAPSATNASGFEVRGSFAAEYKDANLTLNYKFVVVFDDCRWRIRVEPIGQALSNSGISYYEDAHDGQYVYSLRKFVGGSVKSESNTSEAVVDAGQIPCESSIYAPPLWLAFCSGCYFSSAHSNEMDLLFASGDPTARLENRTVKYHGEFHPKAPILPSLVKFFDDGFARYRDKAGRAQASRRAFPFENGFLAQTFYAKHFTNMSGHFIPMEFGLEWFLPADEAKSSNDVRSIGVWAGKVESYRLVSSVNQDEFRPRTDGAALTEDRRFLRSQKDGTRIYYMNTNMGGWIPIANANLSRLHNATVENEGISGRSKRNDDNTTSKIILIIMVLLPPLIFISWTISKRMKQKGA